MTAPSRCHCPECGCREATPVRDYYGWCNGCISWRHLRGDGTLRRHMDCTAEMPALALGNPKPQRVAVICRLCRRDEHVIPMHWKEDAIA